MRAWEVEAARDGRLAGEARRDFEAHLEQCPRCAEEARYLVELAAGLQAIPVPEPLEAAVAASVIRCSARPMRSRLSGRGSQSDPSIPATSGLGPTFSRPQTPS